MSNAVYVRNGVERIFKDSELRTMGKNKPEDFGWQKKGEVPKFQPTKQKPKRSVEFKATQVDEIKAHLRAQPRDVVEKFFEGDNRDQIIALRDDILKQRANA